MKGPWLENFVEALLEGKADDDDTFAKVAKRLQDVRELGCQLMFIGNGGSAAIASHMAIDFMNKGRLHARSFNDAAALTCLANDYGYKTVFEMQLANAIRSGDVLVAISSSGQSENILSAARNAATIPSVSVVTLTGFRFDNPLRQIGTYNFWVPSNNYGIVETAHLGILHALLEEVSG
jgi:D-sedoheptulose 7-phosphate isomerase